MKKGIYLFAAFLLMFLAFSGRPVQAEGEIQVASVEVETVTQIEGVGQYTSSYLDEVSHEWIPFQYYDIYPDAIKVVLQDSTEIRGNFWEVMDQLSVYDLGVGRYDSQEEDARAGRPWGIGKHTAVLQVGEKECEYEVIIEAFPIAQVEVESERVYDPYENYYWDEETESDKPYPRYDAYPRQVKVTLTDGTILEGGIGEVDYQLYEKYDFGINYRDTQLEDYLAGNPWGPGKHTATVYIGSHAWEYEVIVEEFPIAQVEVESVRVYAPYEDTYWEGETRKTYPCYDVYPRQVKVTLTDGTILEGGRWEVNDQLYEKHGFEINWRDTQLEDYLAGNPWGLGKHKAIIYTSIHEWEYEIIVEEFPVAQVEVESLRVNAPYEGTYWEDGIEKAYPCYDAYPRQMKVTLTDGTILKGTRWEVRDQLYDRYDFGIGWSDTQLEDYRAGNPWGPGKHTAIVYIGNHAWEYEVIVEEFPIAQVEVESLRVYAPYERTYWEGETRKTYPCYDVYPCQVKVTLTDGTILEGDRWEVNDQLYEKYGFEINGRDTQLEDYLAGNPWGPGRHKAIINVGVYEWEYEVIVEEFPIAQVEVESVRVDEQPYESYYWDEETESEKTYPRYDVYPRQIKVTLTDGTILEGEGGEVYNQLYEKYGFGIGWGDTQLEDYLAGNPWGPGKHKATVYAGIHAWEYEVIVHYLPGDINGDGKVNIFDVIRLLKHVTGENVEIYANPDVNGEGKVNIFDVIRLLKYVTGEKVEVH